MLSVELFTLFSRVIGVRRGRVHLVEQGLVEEQLGGEHRLLVDVHLQVDVGGPADVPTGEDGGELGDTVRVRGLGAAQVGAVVRGGGLAVADAVGPVGRLTRTAGHVAAGTTRTGTTCATGTTGRGLADQYGPCVSPTARTHRGAWSSRALTVSALVAALDAAAVDVADADVLLLPFPVQAAMSPPRLTVPPTASARRRLMHRRLFSTSLFAMRTSP